MICCNGTQKVLLWHHIIFNSAIILQFRLDFNWLKISKGGIFLKQMLGCLHLTRFLHNRNIKLFKNLKRTQLLGKYVRVKGHSASTTIHELEYFWVFQKSTRSYSDNKHFVLLIFEDRIFCIKNKFGLGVNFEFVFSWGISVRQ